MAVGNVGSRLSLRIICFNERCLKDNDVLSLKNLLTSNLWLINVRPHVSETFSQSIFDSPSIVGKTQMAAGKVRVLRDITGEIFITLQLTEGICLFFQESLIIPLLTWCP